MKRLKTILEYKIFNILIFLFSLIYTFILTGIIKYESIYENETNFHGIVETYKIDGNKVSITFKDKEKLIANYYVKTYQEKKYFEDNLKYGSNITVNGTLTDPNSNSVFNNFNYKKYLYNKRIYKIISADNINIDNTNINIIYTIKNNIVEQIEQRNNYEYIKAFIIGNKDNINSEEYEEYKELGVTHLFAISGMHLTLLSSVILYFFSKFKKFKKTSIILTLILLFIYAMICNFPPSIKRAYTLYLLLSIKKLTNLNINNIYLLLLTISINIFIEPFIIYDTGFLYSISTTFGLLISSKHIKTNNYFLKLLSVSIIAYLCSLPITINSNYQINLITPLNNLIVVPLVSIIIYPLSILTLLFSIINPVFDISLNLLNFINKLLININIFNISIPKMSIILIIVYYLFLFLALYINKKNYILVIFIIILCKIIPFLDDNSYIYFLDVGQGDSALVVSSFKKNVTMIDTGGKITYNQEEWKKQNNNYKVSNNSITLMKSLGIDKINNLVITHGDYDHMGEAISLVNNFKVEKVIFNCGEFNDLENELIKILDKKKIPYYSCIKELNIENNKLYFLQTKEYDNENDNSNVIYTELNGYKFMLMGDAGVEKEKNILDKYIICDIDVLKVGHHGSKTSSSKEFINEINPKYSIISVGKNNRYGHPNKEVLEHLQYSKIYRTDQDGSIMFKIKNNKLEIENCSP